MDRGGGPHILHLTAPANYGGLEKVVEGLAGGLPSLGIRTTVVASVGRDESDHAFVRRLRHQGISVVSLPIGDRNYWGEVKAVNRIAQEIGAHAIHSHGPRSDLIAGLVGWGRDLKTISTLHGFVGRNLTGRARESIQLACLRQFSAVVGVSAPIVERARAAGVAAERAHLIPNAWTGAPPPVDRGAARRLLDLPEDAFVIGWAGRLSPEKGADIFLRGLALLENPGILASIIGAGSQGTELGSLAKALGIDSIVRWHGAQPEAGRLLAAFDVLVLSSRTEGVPIVLFEAMHAGVPIIASAVGGVPSVLGNSEALLVPPESPVELARAMREVQSGRSAARDRAARATEQLTRNFAVGPWLARYADLYRRLLGD